MKKFKVIYEKRKIIIFTIVTIVFALVSLYYIYEVKGHSEGPIRSDGWGYYSYLPAIFDYHNMNFQFSDNSPSSGSGIWTDEYGHTIQKYPIGTAILEFPFFMMADIYTRIHHPEYTNGFSKPYQMGVAFSALFYFAIGLFTLGCLLSRYFTERVVLWTLILITYATNLFHYATFDASFSHVFSFFLITLFVYLVVIIEDDKDSKILNFVLGLCGGGYNSNQEP